MPRHWFRLDDLAPLAAHAIACDRHTTRAEVLARANNGPALILSSTSQGANLRSNGSPAWYDHDGGEHVAPASTWLHVPTGRTGHVHLSDYVHAYFPLIDQVMHLLRTARLSGHSWITVYINPHDQHLIAPYAIHATETRDSIVPITTPWQKAAVTCAEVRDVAYPALIPDGYTTQIGNALPRFDRNTIVRIIADLDRTRPSPDATPGDNPILRLHGDTLTVLEEQPAGGNWTYRQVERLRPDRDGYFALGAYQWGWHLVE